MKLALIGHRGVGKSSLLERMKIYLPELSKDSFVCLDQYIEDFHGIKIRDYFETNGEAAFRKLEYQTFESLVKKVENQEHAIVALGAGFSGTLPKEWTALWIQRGVSSEEAIFLDRPTLDKALKIEPNRFQQRSQRYRDWAHGTLTLEEHRSSSQEPEKQWVRNLLNFIPSLDIPINLFFTLGSEACSFIQSFPGIELRDDLLSDQEIRDFLRSTSQRTLLSFRKPERMEATKLHIKTSTLWDWPVEMGGCPFGSPPILSLHSRTSSLADTLVGFSGTSSIYKLAIPINSFEELSQGHDWWLKDPQKRVFLPISSDGRWQWYRQYMSSGYSFQFFRTGQTNLKDQPTLMQSLHIMQSKNFAAVLGDPVVHSLTPWVHRDFFEARNMPVLSVPLASEEWPAGISFLQKLGLSHAAVTSPLKQKAQALVQSSAPVNTLCWEGSTWVGTNTDALGIKPWGETFAGKKVALWGGGGTLASVLSEFPDLCAFSSRTGKLKSIGETSVTSEKPDLKFSPEILIWAVGRDVFETQGVYPPKHWRPEAVLDLNYTEDSPGKICANLLECDYVNGLGMFESQAKGQQAFWSSYDGK